MFNSIYVCYMQASNEGNDDANSTTGKQRNIRKVLIKIAQEIGRLPSSLVIHDVQLEKSEPVGRGGYAEVFQGKLARTEVALKRFWPGNRGAEGSMRKVSDPIQV
jgi:hypothetical protein